ncbi:MAG: hypothetical protein ACLS5Z_05260 [Clostridium fessum]
MNISRYFQIYILRKCVTVEMVGIEKISTNRDRSVIRVSSTARA